MSAPTRRGTPMESLHSTSVTLSSPHWPVNSCRRARVFQPIFGPPGAQV